MKTIQPNLDTLNTDSFFQLHDGVSLFLGAMNQEGTVFYPFMGLASEYGDTFAFEHRGVLAVHIIEGDHIEADTKPASAIFAKFTEKQTLDPQAVANAALFNRIKEVIA